ncbi:N-acetylmuramoyl-L-alanine amidase family protein [Bacillus sp. UNC41MFS5]|uniref:N-acetylmuramoyl-L-alanine amidase family protein n=1 Tax=Bacillus sp. UNC41MFS5 TaxID=1449046 RepID=UPI000478A90F|nr:N-acetylmuramoyl-L-alanine amidase [Bacillus sp. UNC41MFS5]
MSKTAKIGITIVILLAVILVYFIFNQPQEKGGKDPSAEINEEPVNQEFSKEDQETTKALDEEEEKEEVQNDFLVVIDPGHQRSANMGQEPVGPGASETKIKVTGGTAGVATGKPEYKLTLEASQILGKLLEKRGVKVIYTRTTHDVNISNKERAEIANQNHADLFVRIHADGSTNRNVKGLSVLTPSDDDQYTKAIYQDSLKASQLILDETIKNPAVKVNGISYRGDLSGFNWSKVPSTLIEMGFMSNPSEDENLSDTVYLTNLLTSISDGIINYSNSNK